MGVYDQINEYDNIPSPSGGGYSSSGYTSSNVSGAAKWNPMFNPFPATANMAPEPDVNFSVPMKAQVAAAKEPFYGDLEKGIQMNGITNPHIIDHLSKNVLQPAEELAGKIAKLQERGIDATSQINALKLYLKGPFVKGELAKAKNMQDQIDTMSKSFEKMTGSQMKGLDNPNFLDPYDGGFEAMARRYHPSELEALEKKFRDTRDHSNDNEYGLTRGQAQRNLAGAHELHDEDTMAAVASEIMQKRFPDLAKKVDRGEALTKKEAQQVQNEVHKRIARMESDYVNQMAHTKHVPKERAPVTHIHMGNTYSEDGRGGPPALSELAVATFQAQRSGKHKPINDKIAQLYFGDNKSHSLDVVGGHGGVNNLNYTHVTNADAIYPGMTTKGKYNNAYSELIHHVKSSGAKILLNGNTHVDAHDGGRSVKGDLLISREQLENAYEAYRSRHPKQFGEKKHIFGVGVPFTGENHEENLKKFMDMVGGVKELGHASKPGKQLDDSQKMYSVKAFIRNPLADRLPHNIAMGQDIKAESQPSKIKAEQERVLNRR